MMKKIIGFLIAFVCIFITISIHALPDRTTTQEKQLIIFDNDAASDDVIALVYLLSQPKVKIAAITVAGTGEAHGPQGARNLADVCYLMGKGNIEIAYGQAQSYENLGHPFPDFLRKAMDNVLVDKNIPHHPQPKISDSSVDLIKKVITSSNQKVTILATGPLTNIAEFILLYPQLSKQIEKIVIMGGAVKVKGNIKAVDPNSPNDVAEWNIYADPKAAQIVLTSSIPIVLVPLDATNQVPMTKAFYDSFILQNEFGLKLIHNLLKAIVDEFGMDVFMKEFYLWDTLAAMITVDPSLGVLNKMPIKLDLASAQTKLTTEQDREAKLIDVAMLIPNSQLILPRLYTEISKKIV